MPRILELLVREATRRGEDVSRIEGWSPSARRIEMQRVSGWGRFR
jgi:hypothetical protein